MDGPRNDHAKWNQSDNETPTSNAIISMGNLKKGHNELLFRTDTDSQTLKNLCFPKEMVRGWGDVLGLWDGNAIKLGCDDHCTTIIVINHWVTIKKILVMHKLKWSCSI